MAQTWYLFLFGGAFLFAGIATLLFGRLTAKSINREIESAGLFYMCVNDKVGYTYLFLALALILPRSLANRVVPRWIVDVSVARSYASFPKDTFLSITYCFSTSMFLIVLMYGSLL